ncbi:hypothetical protein Patl1_02301 [Pistacia atlantica]|uniref:Uncharacterized protein n=1 Tax=Pistacia atlantica TaxID=434234 RepID=A0ACC1CDA3_9ROSI|nr:hypothetical protein Patl1_02301 [Pistacia atlantica]
MQFLYRVPTSCHMGEFSCLLRHQLDLQCYSIIRDVHNYVPVVSPTILLVNYVGKLIVGAGIGPIMALKYFRYTYRPSKINALQQAERMGGPILSLGTIEPQARSLEKEVSPLSITQPKSRSPVYEPLLSDSPNTRRSFGAGTPFDFFPSQSRLSSVYSRNCKDN